MDNKRNVLSDIAKRLNDSAASEELVLDALDSFNPILNSVQAQDNINKGSEFFDLFTDIVSGLILDISNNVQDLFGFLSGRQLQEEENKREMVDVLESLKDDDKKPTQLSNRNGDDNEEESGGFFKSILAGITAGFSANFFAGIAALIPKPLLGSLSGLFAPLLSVFSSFAKFGKHILKFAGPVGIAITIITGIIGAIQGAIKGYDEGGVIGAIHGGLVGAFDILIGSLIKGIANIAGWVFTQLGMENIGKVLGPLVEDIFDQVYAMWGGIIDLLHGIFTLDSDKVIASLKTIVSAIIENIKNYGKLIGPLLIDLVPIILKIIKAVFWDIPKFIGEIIAKVLVALPPLIEKLLNFFIEVSWKFFTDFLPWLGKKIFDGVWNFASDLINKALTWIKELIPWDELKNKIFNSGVGFVYVIVKKITKIFTNIKNVLTSVFESITSKIELIRDGINDWISEVIPEPLKKLINLDDEETKKLTPQIKKEKAEAAGYNSWDEYKAADWKWRSDDDLTSSELIRRQRKNDEYVEPYMKKFKPIPSINGQVLNQASSNTNTPPIIINQMGGNVTTTNTNQINNNSSSFDPIISGSAMGFTSI